MTAKNAKNKYILPLITLLIFVTFWAKSYLGLDPDFSYRLVTGQKILAGFFPKRDPYSYTMPSFPYVEHAWTIASLWALLYPFVNRVGIALVSALLGIFALFISAKRRVTTNEKANSKKPFKIFGVDLKYYGQLTFILAVTAILPFVGTRAQIFSWVFLAIFFNYLMDTLKWQKYKYFSPLYFLFWANVHGSWGAGIVILFFVTGIRAIKNRHISIIDWSISISSLLVTLINPYGFGLWREVYLSVSDSSLRWKILEWMPAILSGDLSYVFFLAISLYFVARYRKKFSTENVLVYILLFVQSFLTRRHVPIWILFALPMTTASIVLLQDEVSKIKYGTKRFNILYKYAYVAFFFLLIVKIALSISSSYQISENKFYPKGAVTYLKVDLPEGNIFTTYGWGGYLIQYLPEKKVYIYGAMPSWRWDDNPPEESSDAFDDYLAILQGEKDYTDEFQKYNVNTVLLPKPNSLPVLLANLNSKFSKIINAIGIPTTDFDFHESLLKKGWVKVYEDRNAVIYKK